MKALVITLSLILTIASKVSACSGINEPEIQALIKAAKEVDDLFEDPNNFPFDGSNEKQERILNEDRMIPSAKSDATIGTVSVISNSSPNVESLGNGVKIGKSCILTEAHVLYKNVETKMSENNKGQFDGKITFSRGFGDKKETFKASVFFQMTKKDVDYHIAKVEVNGKISQKRVFYGHNDLVLLKLENHSDSNYKKTKVIYPSVMDAQAKKNPVMISCTGSPSHRTEKTYGSCKGSDFLWTQKGARIFYDHHNGKDSGNLGLGYASNLVASPGMSGGACSLYNQEDTIIGLVSNGFNSTIDGEFAAPKIFVKETGENNARHLSGLHVLNERLNEIGENLQTIVENCK
ncbi:MAG: hypothetical protein L6Q37_00030 [Bdellovibrionaceae bacterium]|nr:hypothetical protein [Pseudobdellovibrionaceae bacterium]NUM58515.1 hypothetical protein [Pseudobdellovibrionaceae bacterium]